LWQWSSGANDGEYVKKHSLDIFPRGREITTWRLLSVTQAFVPGPVDCLDQERAVFRIIKAVIDASMYGRI
jgi:hypothetical protein